MELLVYVYIFLLILVNAYDNFTIILLLCIYFIKKINNFVLSRDMECKPVIFESLRP